MFFFFVMMGCFSSTKVIGVSGFALEFVCSEWSCWGVFYGPFKLLCVQKLSFICKGSFLVFVSCMLCSPLLEYLRKIHTLRSSTSWETTFQRKLICVITDKHIYNMILCSCNICSLFLGLNPSKEGLFQLKQRSFGFQVHISINIYIYLYMSPPTIPKQCLITNTKTTRNPKPQRTYDDSESRYFYLTNFHFRKRLRPTNEPNFNSRKDWGMPSWNWSVWCGRCFYVSSPPCCL